jgi:hypothetical protein
MTSHMICAGSHWLYAELNNNRQGHFVIWRSRCLSDRCLASRIRGRRGLMRSPGLSFASTWAVSGTNQAFWSYQVAPASRLRVSLIALLAIYPTFKICSCLGWLEKLQQALSTRQPSRHSNPKLSTCLGSLADNSGASTR